jgi:hypothetical protein
MKISRVLLLIVFCAAVASFIYAASSGRCPLLGIFAKKEISCGIGKPGDWQYKEVHRISGMGMDKKYTTRVLRAR